MNINTIIKRTANSIGKFFLGNSVGSPSFVSWFMPGTWSKADMLRQYKRYVYSIVSTIAESAAAIELEMYKSGRMGNSVPLYNHEFLKLMKKPNPMESQFQFLERHFTFMELAGESFWYLARGAKTGLPREMYLLRPDLMDVVIDKSDPRGLVKGYLLHKGDGKDVAFDREEILHFKLPNPLNPYRGMGVVEAAQAFIQTEAFATDWTKNSIYNAGRPSGILGIKGTIGEDQWESVKRTFKNEYSGTENAGKTMLLKDIDGIYFQKLGMDLEGVELKDLKNLTRDDIMVMWKTSKTMLGITDDVNRANAREARAVFKENLIKPKVERFMDHINAFLIEPTYGESIFLSYEDLTVTSDQDKLNEWKEGYNKWLTTNDIRREKGDKPLAGGDLIYMPLTMVPTIGDIPEEEPVEPTEPEEPAEPAPNEDEPKENPEDNPEDQPEDQEEEKSKKKAKKKSVKKEIVKKEVTIRKGQAEIFRQLLYRIAKKWTKKYKRIIDTELDKQLNELLEQNSGKSVSSKKKDISGWIPNFAEFKKNILALVVPLIDELMKEQAKVASDLIDSTVEFNIDDVIQKYITDRTSLMVDNLGNDIVDKLTGTLTQGIQDGDSVKKLKDRVKEVYGQMKDSRAELIARTETIAMSNHAAVEAYRQSSIVKKLKWYSNPGCCEYCQSLDGKTVGVTEMFALLGQEIEGNEDNFYKVNYDNIEHPPLHPNCECTVLPVVEE